MPVSSLAALPHTSSSACAKPLLRDKNFKSSAPGKMSAHAVSNKNFNKGKLVNGKGFRFRVGLLGNIALLAFMQIKTIDSYELRGGNALSFLKILQIYFARAKELIAIYTAELVQPTDILTEHKYTKLTPTSSVLGFMKLLNGDLPYGHLETICQTLRSDRAMAKSDIHLRR